MAKLKYDYVLDSRAQDEYESAGLWYADKSQQTSLIFLDEVELALETIKTNPRSFKNLFEDFYEFNLNKFPFTIVFIIRGYKVIITSIFHQKRNPAEKYKCGSENLLHHPRTANTNYVF